MGELIIPEIVAIRDKFDSQVPAIRQHFSVQLADNVKSKKNLALVAGGLGLGFIAAGTGFAFLESVIAMATGAIVLAGVSASGIALWTMFPRLQASLAASERQRIEEEMNAFIEKKIKERDRHIEAVKEQVRSNPISFLEADYNRRSALYEAQRKVVTAFAGKMRAHIEKFDRKRKDKPGMDLSAEQSAIDKMVLFHKNRMERLDTAYQLLIRFNEKVDQARTRWELQKSAYEALTEERQMNADLDGAFQQVLSDVAFDEVNGEFQSVFAAIEVDAQEMTAKRMSFAPDLVIDVTDHKVPEITSQ